MRLDGLGVDLDSLLVRLRAAASSELGNDPESYLLSVLEQSIQSGPKGHGRSGRLPPGQSILAALDALIRPQGNQEPRRVCLESALENHLKEIAARQAAALREWIAGLVASPTHRIARAQRAAECVEECLRALGREASDSVAARRADLGSDPAIAAKRQERQPRLAALSRIRLQAAPCRRPPPCQLFPHRNRGTYPAGRLPAGLAPLGPRDRAGRQAAKPGGRSESPGGRPRPASAAGLAGQSAATDEASPLRRAVFDALSAQGGTDRRDGPPFGRRSPSRFHRGAKRRPACPSPTAAPHGPLDHYGSAQAHRRGANHGGRTADSGRREFLRRRGPEGGHPAITRLRRRPACSWSRPRKSLRRSWPNGWPARSRICRRSWLTGTTISWSAAKWSSFRCGAWPRRYLIAAFKASSWPPGSTRGSTCPGRHSELRALSCEL